ncbi:hypothetical protein [Pseudogracilibacillus auburnensis]|uniref:hypothetical protein n=1 Tax=Pseudogracilibacillus auburnensis TaxID=1494959 RepID=UPI001A95D073|nr:hypothetical protein [Pseudogracilibacillus auburnensis]MBO1003178.1 hypothetical protein [Pseudogracilibacillus auburnensis]
MEKILREYDLVPISLEYNTTDINELGKMNTEILIEISLKAACNKEVDALLISCGE